MLNVLPGSALTAVNMLKEIDVTVMESIVINELCEWKGRENLADNGVEVEVTSLVKTESVDDIQYKRGCFCCKTARSHSHCS